MKRQAGFSLMELLVATALMVVIVGTTLRALSDATHANEAVTLMADSQENLRAAMNYMTKDIIEAGEGLPQGGIPIPNSATLLKSGSRTRFRREPSRSDWGTGDFSTQLS